MLKFTEKELTTMLAALRHFQDAQDDMEPEDLRNHFPHFGDGTEPLSNTEIDVLCERLNCGE